MYFRFYFNFNFPRRGNKQTITTTKPLFPIVPEFPEILHLKLYLAQQCQAFMKWTQAQ